MPHPMALSETFIWNWQLVFHLNISEPKILSVMYMYVQF